MLVFLIALDANYERARSSSTSSSTFGGLFYSDAEALEGEFLDLSEGPSEFEEIVELVPCEARSSDNANIFTDQEGYTDQDGWTRRHYLDKLGFTQLLWKTLQELRFHNPPEYYWRKEDTCHK
uniref:Uncharacterized protein n=1 Tax=Setaria viridis TaxID=4556 RepID=A0A4U6UI69_SETVI|nr:hypothetical protein SEVIR_5G212601v2 [Setaria viridis]